MVAVAVLPFALVEKIVVSFGDVMPDGVFLRLRGRVLDVRAARGGGWSGETLGRLPWPPMPASMKWRLAVQGVYETVARGIGSVATGGPARRAPSEDIFRIKWPVPDAKVRLDISDIAIRATFLDPSGQPVLAMPEVAWDGSKPADRRQDPTEHSSPIRYVGVVPDDVRQQDAQGARDREARSAAITSVVDEVIQRDPGTDKEAIRRAFRDAIAAHPEVDIPPGSSWEGRLVDFYAAGQGRFAAARTGIELTKAVHSFVRLLLGGGKTDDG